MDIHQRRGAGALRPRDPRAIEEWFLANADSLYTFVLFRVGKHGEEAAMAEVERQRSLRLTPTQGG